MKKNLFTENDILKLYHRGLRRLEIREDDILTPAAKDKIKTLGITLKIIEHSVTDLRVATENKAFPEDGELSVVIGSDHTGFLFKKIISEYLRNNGFDVIDVGPFSEESCDYPDFAIAVAQKVARREVPFGIILDATGNPSAITANKVAGIRAAVCYNEFSAKSSREHNNANILALGARSLGIETIKSIIDVFFKTEFAGGRHQRRLDKISAIEKRFNNRNSSQA